MPSVFLHLTAPRHSDSCHFFGRTHLPHDTVSQIKCTNGVISFRNDLSIVGTIYTVSQKKVPTFKLSVISPNLNRFSKFLHCWKAYEICYKSHTTVPIRAECQSARMSEIKSVRPGWQSLTSWHLYPLTPSTPAVPNCCCSKCPAPYWSNPPFIISGTVAQSWAPVPERQNVKN